ncbi:uncharacterized protein KD926_008151 [Aspergillus affinis]|uniref:uncharacterized protein n=1 Tax=Aspergillus affinis TaxID=1070780 RepID=UPI0022FED368|nr:uncharacterized protein KD926_008151 [Aspergillus affinis]KAI9040584.1 hypothetical protein KD926_008151 [Aspergillus affinis]
MPGILLADNSDAVKYFTVEHLLDVARQQYNSLQKLETSQQILKFRQVTVKEFNVLSADETRPCKFIKFQYHRPTETLLVKVMPGWDHEIIAALVRKMIDKQLMAMNVDDECLSLPSPLNDLGNWIKEPDLCWAPITASSKPTCVIEIGTSESASHLSFDAHGWLEAPQSPVQAVITISFKYLCAETDDNPITISVWKQGHQVTDIDTRNNLCPAVRTSCVDILNIAGSLSVSGFYLDIDTGVTVSADNIHLPLELFISRQAVNPGEHDVVITKDMLIGLLHQLWEYRRQRRTSQ